MTFAFVIDGVILAEAATIATTARPLGGGEWVLDLANAPVETQRACGWFEVITVERPPDTTTTTCDRALVLVDGIPTEQWTGRDKTQDELDADTRATNEAALTTDATSNIDTLLATVAALNVLTAVANSTINASPAAYVKDVARECKTVARQSIRLARLATDSTLSADTGN